MIYVQRSKRAQINKPVFNTVSVNPPVAGPNRFGSGASKNVISIAVSSLMTLRGYVANDQLSVRPSGLVILVGNASPNLLKASVVLPRTFISTETPQPVLTAAKNEDLYTLGYFGSDNSYQMEISVSFTKTFMAGQTADGQAFSFSKI